MRSPCLSSRPSSRVWFRHMHDNVRLRGNPTVREGPWPVGDVPDRIVLGVGKRLVSGRNSVDYSMGISDPRADIAKTGHAVLSIWNARINELRTKYADMRLVVLLRNMSTREFCLFEQPMTVFPPTDYSWELNARNNLEGRDKASDNHVFTWQPHGSQFTIIRPVPGSARRFTICERPERVGFRQVLDAVGFEDSWIVIADGPEEP